jgi:hypothetical protein
LAHERKKGQQDSLWLPYTHDGKKEGRKEERKEARKTTR